MSDEQGDDGAAPRTPAEERLASLLALVRSEPARGEQSLVESVMRTARWQYATRGILLSVTELAGAVGGLVTLLLGGRGRHRPPEEHGDDDGGGAR